MKQGQITTKFEMQPHFYTHKSYKSLLMNSNNSWVFKKRLRELKIVGQICIVDYNKSTASFTSKEKKKKPPTFITHIVKLYTLHPMFLIEIRARIFMALVLLICQFVFISVLRKAGSTLIGEMHRKGLNIRCLGLIRSCTKMEEIKYVTFIEMLARLLKTNLRQHWRQLMQKEPSSEEESFKFVTAKYLNLVLGQGEKSSLYWQFDLKPQLSSKFKQALAPTELTIEVTNLWVCEDLSDGWLCG